MRPLRWKTKYLTGTASIDNHNLALVNLLNESISAANRIEHCQDFNDWHHSLMETIETTLSQPKSTFERTPYQEKIQHLVQIGLPLPAKNGSACRDCGLCDQLGEQVGEWLTKD